MLAAPAGASVSPDRLVSSALAAANAQRSVHYVMTAESRSKVGVRMIGDAALDRGIQRITYHQAGKSGRVTVIVVANTAYIRGDAFTLENYMGFPRARAKGFANRWLKIPQAAPRFDPTAEAVRLRSAIKEMRVPKPRAALPERMLNGQRVIGIRNTSIVSGQRVTRTLYVRASGRRLPVAEVQREHGSANVEAGLITITFSKWREPVSVSAPTNATVIH